MKKIVSNGIKIFWANVLPDIVKVRNIIGLIILSIFYKGGLLCVEN